MTKKVILEKFDNENVEDITFDEYMKKFTERLCKMTMIPEEIIDKKMNKKKEKK